MSVEGIKVKVFFQINMSTRYTIKDAFIEKQFLNSYFNVNPKGRCGFLKYAPFFHHFTATVEVPLTESPKLQVHMVYKKV